MQSKEFRTDLLQIEPRFTERGEARPLEPNLVPNYTTTSAKAEQETEPDLN